jgi:hypothetical protein
MRRKPSEAALLTSFSHCTKIGYWRPLQSISAGPHQDSGLVRRAYGIQVYRSTISHIEINEQLTNSTSGHWRTRLGSLAIKAAIVALE